MTPERPGTGSVLAERYRLTAHLGQDGAAEVFRADDLPLARTVTVTLLPPPDAGPVPYAETDLQVRAALVHPALVPVLDRGEAGGHPYVVTEVTPGEALADRVARGPLPTGETVRVGAALADALTHLHADHVAHGDVTADRVFLADDGRVLLHGVVPGPLGAATAPPEHRAPELLWQWQASPPGDVYALGALLTACVTGVVARPGGAEASGPEAGLHRSWEAAAAAAPEPLAALLVPMTRTDPQLRPPASEIAARLGGRGGSWPPTPAGPAPAGVDTTGVDTTAAYAAPGVGENGEAPTGPMPAPPLHDDLAARTGVAGAGALASVVSRLRAVGPRGRGPVPTAVAAALGVVLLAVAGVLLLGVPGATPPAPAPTGGAAGTETERSSPDSPGGGPSATPSTRTGDSSPTGADDTGTEDAEPDGAEQGGPDAGGATPTATPTGDAPSGSGDTTSSPEPPETAKPRGRSDDAPGRGHGHDKDHPGKGGG